MKSISLSPEYLEEFLQDNELIYSYEPVRNVVELIYESINTRQTVPVCEVGIQTSMGPHRTHELYVTPDGSIYLDDAEWQEMG